MFITLKSSIITKLFNFRNSKELCKVLCKDSVFNNQTATLTRAAFRDENDIPLRKPFPYHLKPYSALETLLDFEDDRVHKESKLIVIDGPVACGKEKVAKELAKAFDFLYIPQPTFDDLYITHWGFDVRTLDCKLPKDAQTWDIERFLHNPKDENTTMMQLYMLYLRQVTYMKAVTHIVATGQGVVTIRSPWNDKAFARAMFMSGYISEPAYHLLLCTYEAIYSLYVRPHLFIYLDVPVDITLENIKKRGQPFEKTSEVLQNKHYHHNLEEGIKYDLIKLKRHSLQLFYDWSEEGVCSDIVDDIEELNFDNYLESSLMFEDWREHCFKSRTLLKRYTYHAPTLLFIMDLVTFIPELTMSAESKKKWDEVWSEIDDGKYEAGFNPLKGDKNLLWKRYYAPSEDHVTPLMEKYKERLSKFKVNFS